MCRTFLVSLLLFSSYIANGVFVAAMQRFFLQLIILIKAQQQEEGEKNGLKTETSVNKWICITRGERESREKVSLWPSDGGNFNYPS